MRDQLDALLGRIQSARIDTDQMKAEQKLCHDTFGVVMKLRDHPPFWPNKFSVQTFVKIEGDLMSVDATVELALQRLSTATGSAKDMAQYLKISDMYNRQGIQPPVDKSGNTVDDAFMEAETDGKVALEDIPTLRAELERILGDMDSLLR